MSLLLIITSLIFCLQQITFFPCSFFSAPIDLFFSLLSHAFPTIPGPSPWLISLFLFLFLVLYYSSLFFRFFLIFFNICFCACWSIPPTLAAKPGALRIASNPELWPVKHKLGVILLPLMRVPSTPSLLPRRWNSRPGSWTAD